MTPQEQEEKCGEARAVATEAQRELVGRLVSEAIDWSDKDKAPAFSDGKREWYRVKGAALQAVLTDAETLARSSSSPASSDTESKMRGPQRQVMEWEDAVPHNHENPNWFSRDCLRCQDTARLRLHGEVRRLEKEARDPTPEPPPVSGGPRADEDGRWWTLLAPVKKGGDIIVRGPALTEKRQFVVPGYPENPDPHEPPPPTPSASREREGAERADWCPTCRAPHPVICGHGDRHRHGHPSHPHYHGPNLCCDDSFHQPAPPERVGQETRADASLRFFPGEKCQCSQPCAKEDGRPYGGECQLEPASVERVGEDEEGRVLTDREAAYRVDTEGDCEYVQEMLDRVGPMSIDGIAVIRYQERLATKRLLARVESLLSHTEAMQEVVDAARAYRATDKLDADPNAWQPAWTRLCNALDALEGKG